MPEETPKKSAALPKDAGEEPDIQKPLAPPQKVSPLDPDFLIFALPWAALIDILDLIFEIGTIASLILGIPLILWLMSRTGREVKTQDVKRDIQRQQQQRQMAKAAAKRALRRGIFVFIAEAIPILNLLPFWVIFVLSALKEQPAHSPNAGA